MLVCQDAKRELEKQRQADLSAQDFGSSALKDGRNRCNAEGNPGSPIAKENGQSSPDEEPEHSALVLLLLLHKQDCV